MGERWGIVKNETSNGGYTITEFTVRAWGDMEAV